MAEKQSHKVKLKLKLFHILFYFAVYNTVKLNAFLGLPKNSTQENCYDLYSGRFVMSLS